MSEHSPGTGQVLILEEIGKQFLAVVGGALADPAASGEVTEEDTIMAYVKQLIGAQNSLGELFTHSTLIFPALTNLTCTLTAHSNANEWSAWGEVVDSGANPLSSVFAAKDGHVTGMITEEANQNDTEYMVQLAYGASKTPISSWRLISGTGKVSSTGQSAARGVHIPTGETVYARVMCATAGSKTLLVHFRHFLHS